MSELHSNYNKASHSMLDESNRRTLESSKELEQYRIKVRVLQDENLELRKVMEMELHKRKHII